MTKSPSTSAPFPPPPGWDASPSQGFLPALTSPVPIHTPGWRERGTVRVKCLAQARSKMSPTSAPAQTAISADKSTNHDNSAPLIYVQKFPWNPVT